MKWLFFSLFLFLLSFAQDDDPYRAKRDNMVNSQIKARGVRDAGTLAAMRNVPRHLFVPKDQLQNAYLDRPLPIGYGQTISQPYIVAYMTEAIRLKKHFRVLEIGTGSGYQAAVLAEIVDTVFTIEILEELGKIAKERLQVLGYTNVVAKTGDGYQGWQEKGPFDAILVTAAPEKIPQPLIDQLKEGGRMVIPVGAQYMTQRLVLVEKEKEKVRTKNLMYVRFVPFTRPD
jgi:protein-L-isoaspartate(D-aspartate) O-methyltransferase